MRRWMRWCRSSRQTTTHTTYSSKAPRNAAAEAEVPGTGSGSTRLGLPGAVAGTTHVSGS
jgi:hypothetical protein